MLGILILAVFLNAADITLSMKTCSDCMAYTSCEEAKQLAFYHKSPKTATMFLEAFCGVEYIQLERVTKVCCSHFTLSGIDDRSGMSGSQNEKQVDNPQLKLLPASCGDIDGTRIIRGDVAGLYEFPWMALISYKRRDGQYFMCAGSIINSRYILTAAHCAAKKNINGVRVGDHDISTKEDCQGVKPRFCESHVEDLGIEKIIIHEKWNNLSSSHDIALLRLERNIDLNHKNILPICLPVTDELRYKNLDNVNAVVAGWGVTETGQDSTLLYKANFEIKTMDKCRSVYDWDPKQGVDKLEGQICAGAPHKDTCRGDSGGPLLVESVYNGIDRIVQYGVISTGSKICGIDVPTKFTDVRNYVDWILENIRE
ncbi:serine protease grass-like [Colias croceus]|uniref:serine protease grass-like n=1 Tax=Colias crocea TaxID=72248 RepID=UPI001E281898|nr:serine protease grass-like [Colias croceus]